ncbi:DUF2759 domain-containing protein [Virgibacillus sp. MSP4-1]|uniref:DUF2759 domain-containing protein n=1 Tax=Virgibacillus sp. MSP4-1 TaxID=2700081 RepID=UPI00039BBD8D|nr:DUF2759 domain-containing protein [Virgibacillus sp. MSP4-1]QHS22754.1 DUF2759 domain-containing protein [Virgibacillus sp. MSP4-1]
MVLGIMLLVVTIICAIAVIRGLKERNLFAAGFAGISVLVFGWFSVMTIYSELFPDA